MQNYSNSSLYSQSYRKSLNLFKNDISLGSNPHKSSISPSKSNTSEPNLSSQHPSPSPSLSSSSKASTNVSTKQIHPNKPSLRTTKGSPNNPIHNTNTPITSKTTNEGAYAPPPPPPSYSNDYESKENQYSKDHLHQNLTDDIFIEADSFKEYKYKSTSGIHTEKFQKLTYKILYDLYPKYCPKCNVILSKGVKNRPDLVRCGNKNCHHQVSRLSYTPLHHFKLPIWMFGYILEESILQFPKVITSVEISKRLSISYKSARLLKQRIQVFSSHQVEVLRKLYYHDLKETFKDVTLPKVEDGKDVKKHLGKKLYRKIPHTDTAVLYSASQRSNQHRKRFRHGGLTASIYQSDSVGGKQIGILVSTIATQNGCVFFDSVPDQKANTLGTLIRKTVPYESPLFSDEGYPWLWGIYKKHRTINHQAHSKDKRHKFAKNRWSKYSIHNQVAEGNQRLLKSAFSAYCYIKPTYSQLYLNELSFYKSIMAVGMDRLVSAQREGVVRNVSRIYTHKNTYLKDQIAKYCYYPLTLEDRNRQKTASVLNQGNPKLESIYQSRKLKNLHFEIKRNDDFWKNPEIKYYIKSKEKYYGSIAKNLWNALTETKNRKWVNFNKTVVSTKLPKRTSLRIVRRWAELKIVSIVDYQNFNTERQGYDYLIKLNIENIPKLLYHQTRLEFEGGQNKIRKYIKTKKRKKHYGRKE